MKRGFVIFVLLLLSISCISAATMHQASSVFVKIDGTSRNLDTATSYFTASHTYVSAASSLATGQHDASQIWIKVKDGEMTLLNALTTNKLCPPTSATNSYSGTINPGHLGTEIQLASGKTLQKAIDDGNLRTPSCPAPVNGGWTDWKCGACSKVCGGGTKTCTRTCTNPAPAYGGANCVGDSSKTESCNTAKCPTWKQSSTFVCGVGLSGGYCVDRCYFCPSHGDTCYPSDVGGWTCQRVSACVVLCFCTKMVCSY